MDSEPQTPSDIPDGARTPSGDGRSSDDWEMLGQPSPDHPGGPPDLHRPSVEIAFDADLQTLAQSNLEGTAGLKSRACSLPGAPGITKRPPLGHYGRASLGVANPTKTNPQHAGPSSRLLGTFVSSRASTGSYRSTTMPEQLPEEGPRQAAAVARRMQSLDEACDRAIASHRSSADSTSESPDDLEERPAHGSRSGSEDPPLRTQPFSAEASSIQQPLTSSISATDTSLLEYANMTKSSQGSRHMDVGHAGAACKARIDSDAEASASASHHLTASSCPSGILVDCPESFMPDDSIVHLSSPLELAGSSQAGTAAARSGLSTADRSVFGSSFSEEGLSRNGSSHAVLAASGDSNSSSRSHGAAFTYDPHTDSFLPGGPPIALPSSSTSGIWVHKPGSAPTQADTNLPPGVASSALYSSGAASSVSGQPEGHDSGKCLPSNMSYAQRIPADQSSQSLREPTAPSQTVTFSIPDLNEQSQLGSSVIASKGEPMFVDSVSTPSLQHGASQEGVPTAAAPEACQSDFCMIGMSASLELPSSHAKRTHGHQASAPVHISAAKQAHTSTGLASSSNSNASALSEYDPALPGRSMSTTLGNLVKPEASDAMTGMSCSTASDGSALTHFSHLASAIPEDSEMFCGSSAFDPVSQADVLRNVQPDTLPFPTVGSKQGQAPGQGCPAETSQWESLGALAEAALSDTNEYWRPQGSKNAPAAAECFPGTADPAHHAGFDRVGSGRNSEGGQSPEGSQISEDPRHRSGQAPTAAEQPSLSTIALRSRLYGVGGSSGLRSNPLWSPGISAAGQSSPAAAVAAAQPRPAAPPPAASLQAAVASPAAARRTSSPGQPGSRAVPNANIILFGSTGSGKSMLGNTLLGASAFASQRSAGAVTLCCQRASVRAASGTLHVVDTPGVAGRTPEARRDCARRILAAARSKLSSNGLATIVLLVLSAASSLRPEDEACVLAIRSAATPPSGQLPLAIAVTHADELASAKLDVRRWLMPSPSALADLACNMGDHVAMVDNRNGASGAGRDHLLGVLHSMAMQLSATAPGAALVESQFADPGLRPSHLPVPLELEHSTCSASSACARGPGGLAQQGMDMAAAPHRRRRLSFIPTLPAFPRLPLKLLLPVATIGGLMAFKLLLRVGPLVSTPCKHRRARRACKRISPCSETTTQPPGILTASPSTSIGTVEHNQEAAKKPSDPSAKQDAAGDGQGEWSTGLLPHLPGMRALSFAELLDQFDEWIGTKRVYEAMNRAAATEWVTDSDYGSDQWTSDEGA